MCQPISPRGAVVRPHFRLRTSQSQIPDGFRDALALLDRYSDIVTNQDPSRPLLRIHEAPESGVRCACCDNLAVERGKEAQKELWKGFPRIFDIEVDGW